MYEKSGGAFGAPMNSHPMDFDVSAGLAAEEVGKTSRIERGGGLRRGGSGLDLSVAGSSANVTRLPCSGSILAPNSSLMTLYASREKKRTLRPVAGVLRSRRMGRRGPYLASVVGVDGRGPKASSFGEGGGGGGRVSLDGPANWSVVDITDTTESGFDNHDR